MRIHFTTNIDAYNEITSAFPTFVSDSIPRKGEFIEVNASVASHFRSKKLPLRLEVVSVTWISSDHVRCELWYNKTDKELSEMSGGKTL
jgi:hypothetical protein